jgi:tRNA pseudouridine55 synthase
MTLIAMKKSSRDAINGILLVNKPQGLSSNAVLQKVKHLYNARKAGHTGSLDPLATGMLPICFGEATKICHYVLTADKTYQATGLLGIKTTTGDALGDIVSQSSNVVVTRLELEIVINQFIGPIIQTPSMFSALKYQGQPLYKLARAGISIDRKPRMITIYAIKLLHFDGHTFSINVSCSKGTYIRNLIEDIGEALNVYAHVTQLHRLYTTGFKTQQMYTLEALTNQDITSRLSCLLPLEQAIDYLPIIVINSLDISHLQQGKRVYYKQNIPIDLIRLHDLEANFIGLGQLSSDGYIKAKRLMAY